MIKMKPSKVLLLIGAILVFSCSKDDDPEPSLESAEISFAGNTQVIVAPPALTTSSDPYAQMAAAWIESVNSVGEFTTFFEKPDGATKSTTRITASNGRTAATSEEFLVYTWTDQQSGTSIAFQVSAPSDHYTWEIFFKLTSGGEWLKYLHAEEKKDKSSGFMKVYDVFGFIGENASTLIASYEWSRSGDIFNFEMDSDLFELDIDMSVNTKTKAGSVVYYFEDVKTYEIQWNADGSGTWKYYDSQGNLVEQGAWTD